jgi:hypothetical protein
MPTQPATLAGLVGGVIVTTNTTVVGLVNKSMEAVKHGRLETVVGSTISRPYIF